MKHSKPNLFSGCYSLCLYPEDDLPDTEVKRFHHIDEVHPDSTLGNNYQDSNQDSSEMLRTLLSGNILLACIHCVSLLIPNCFSSPGPLVSHSCWSYMEPRCLWSIICITVISPHPSHNPFFCPMGYTKDPTNLNQFQNLLLILTFNIH